MADGDMINVDIRYNFPLDGGTVALVTAGNSSNDSIAIYKVNPANGHLIDVAASIIIVNIAQVYGSCMYHSPVDGKYYVFVDARNGNVEQWELFDNGSGLVAATSVRIFDVGLQVEGCVDDDELAKFYIGEEETGIWKYGAEPGDGTSRTSVDNTSSGHLTGDVEGITLYYGDNGTGYLIASDQGSDEYVVYEREGSNDYVATFEIVDNTDDGIDATSYTDGVDVVSFPLGASFGQGLFVVQDDKDNGGDLNQNFKLVPWENIANAAGLNIHTSGDPRLVGAAPNQAPVANDQSLETNEDTALPITLTASDGDNDQGDLSFSIVGNPSHGILSVRSQRNLHPQLGLRGQRQLQLQSQRRQRRLQHGDHQHHGQRAERPAGGQRPGSRHDPGYAGRHHPDRHRPGDPNCRSGVFHPGFPRPRHVDWYGTESGLHSASRVHRQR
jgi:3-phytase